MDYFTALRFFAFMLALIGAGLMAIVAHFVSGPYAVAPDQNIPHASISHMPAAWPRNGARYIVVSFVAFAIACSVVVYA
ncbi:hypothetical protein [Paraburkholderia dinghuensis]|uniref:Uncharacterized protein n=1 Tax=Paraburkholderia dinghuensis TaxID=2305225 RepID=A0A3N6MCG1_9BURK|nr:hypothetical protein [Paraburkholderia dinghuensis]RQH01584.1 hypothetical protein D1Y85_23620 [Paraburkholderia dinghuensis]